MTDNKMEKLGDVIKKTRKMQGLTQQQLSATANVGLRFIKELERGKQSCHMGKVLMVLEMLGIEVMIDGETL